MFLRASGGSQDLLFYLLQTELGDIFKLTISYTGKEVHGIELQYLDTIPVATSLCIFRKGYLFAPSDRGNHCLYRILGIGSKEENKVKSDCETSMANPPLFFARQLKNFELIEEFDNLACITDLKVGDLLKENYPQIYVLCAAGSRSTLRILRHGLSVTTIAETQLNASHILKDTEAVTGIFEIKNYENKGFTKYIVISFRDQTVVLSVSEQIQQIPDSQLQTQQQTIFACTLEQNQILQVLTNSIRLIHQNKVQTWQSDDRIVRAVANKKQVAVVIAGNKVTYFEHEVELECKLSEPKLFDNEITAIDIGDIPADRQKFPFLAIGLSNREVKILSLDENSYLDEVGHLALPSANTESLCFLHMPLDYHSGDLSVTQLCLFVGMNNGLLLRSNIDQISGQVTDTRNKLIGTKPVRCSRYVAMGIPALLALSSRPWICYNYLGKYTISPISMDTLDYASLLNTENCTEGVIATSKNTLKIFIPDKYGDIFNQTKIPLQYSPRKMIINQKAMNLILMESDHRILGKQESDKMKQLLAKELGMENKMDEFPPETQIGPVYAGEGKWASCLRIFDPIQQKTVQLLELEPNEHAVSMALISPSQYPMDSFLIVGCVKELVLQPVRKFTSASIQVYQVLDNGSRLQFMHMTKVDDIPMAITEWKGKILCGIGNRISAYELGKQKLLKKAEIKELNTSITGIQVFGDRIFASSVNDSIHVYKYRQKEQTFYEVADDILPRWMTCFQVVDYHTVVGADKFENIFVSRIPQSKPPAFPPARPRSHAALRPQHCSLRRGKPRAGAVRQGNGTGWQLWRATRHSSRNALNLAVDSPIRSSL